MKKIALFLGIVITVLSIIPVLYFMFRGDLPVAEIQDFPGLEQEFDKLEEDTQLSHIQFEGHYGNRITIGAWKQSPSSASDCEMLADAARMYISEDYHLTVEVITPSVVPLANPLPSTHTCS